MKLKFALVGLIALSGAAFTAVRHRLCRSPLSDKHQTLRASHWFVVRTAVSARHRPIDGMAMASVAMAMACVEVTDTTVRMAITGLSSVLTVNGEAAN